MQVRRSRGRWSVLAAALLAAILGTATAHGSPILQQVSDFENGTTQGWTNGGGATDPVNVTTGGPAGAADNFVRVTARGGSGPGSRLAVFNRSTPWIGNFAAPGVTSIEMDLKNFGTTPLLMRLGLQETGGTRFASTTAFNLSADGLWHHATFGIGATSLTRSGPTPIATALTRVSELRIIHSAGADFMGDPISSSVGVDNVRAVPEPASLALFAIGAGGLLSRRRRR